MTSPAGMRTINSSLAHSPRLQQVLKENNFKAVKTKGQERLMNVYVPNELNSQDLASLLMVNSEYALDSIAVVYKAQLVRIEIECGMYDIVVIPEKSGRTRTEIEAAFEAEAKLADPIAADLDMFTTILEDNVIDCAQTLEDTSFMEAFYKIAPEK